MGPCSNALCIHHLDLMLFSAFGEDLGDGTEVPSGLQVVQNSKGWLLRQVVVLPSRGRSTGRRVGKTGMSCTSVKGSAKPQHRLGISSWRAERCRHTGESPHRATGVTDWQGRAQKGGAAPSEEERVYRILSVCINSWWQRVKEKEPHSSQRFLVTGQ